MDRKPLGCHRAWQGWTVGNAKGPRALAVCVKIKGVRAHGRACTCRCLPWEQAPTDTSKESRLKQFSFFFPESIKPHSQTKLQSQLGVWVSPLYWTKSPVNHHRGSEGWSKLKRGDNGSLGLHTLTRTHSLWKNAWIINLGEKKTRKKPRITLNWCSVCVSDKGFHKKKELDEPKNATDVNACSHGYWIGYNGGVHEEESLIQAEVHFTVGLAYWEGETENHFTAEDTWPGAEMPMV